MIKIKYYFGIASPFSYLANPRIFALADEFKIALELKPYAIDNPGSPSNLDPNHARYMRADLQRLSEYYKLPIKFNKKVPDGRPSLEFFFIANENGKGREYIIEASHAFWALGRDIDLPEVLAEIGEFVGLSKKNIEAKCGDKLLKKRLRDSIDEGISEGVFGVPTIVIGKELFWGQDRIFLVREELKRLCAK